MRRSRRSRRRSSRFMIVDGSTSRLCGISDEASASLQEQLAVHRELGWQHIELRSIDGVPVGHMPLDRMSAAVALLNESGVRVVALDSTIGSAATTIAADTAGELRELDVLLRWASATTCRFIRVMSFPNAGLGELAWF